MVGSHLMEDNHPTDSGLPINRRLTDNRRPMVSRRLSLAAHHRHKGRNGKKYKVLSTEYKVKDKAY